MGFWLSRLHAAKVAPVTYVRVNDKLHNLGCARLNGLYKAPRNRSVAVHFVKTAGGMQYVWGVLVDHNKHNATICQQMTGDGRL